MQWGWLTRATQCPPTPARRALEYCHSRNVIHRDVKPENLLLTRSAPGAPETLKLADFGWSVAQRRDSRRTTMCGTVEYLPPEIVNGQEYSFGFDMWTVGVLVYEMLVGRSPFFAADHQAIMSRILAGHFDVPLGVPADAIDLVVSLLQRDPAARPSAAAVLLHPWLQRCGV